MKEKNPTIAFEGINRVGKGTQIEKLKLLAKKKNINAVEIRGDGTRNGLGLHKGDPLSEWWQEYSKYLRTSGTTDNWNYAAYILANDIKIWREDRINTDKQLILFDRSLISRATFILDRNPPNTNTLTMENLYPFNSSNRINLEDILPDIIFELVAPKETILSRLDSQDPKFSFRSKIIEEQYDRFYSAKNYLPNIVQERIISIDSSREINIVFDEIEEKINPILNLF